MIGVLVFLLFVLLIYRAALSPSTTDLSASADAAVAKIGALTDWHVQVHQDTVEFCRALSLDFSGLWQQLTDIAHRNTNRFRAISNHHATTSKTDEQRLYYLSRDRIILSQ